MSENKSKTIKIICDQRECASEVNKDLENLSTEEITVEVTLEQLSVGDYLLADDIVIERKAIADLETSIMDGRIFNQLAELQKIPRSGLIVEGELSKLFSDKARIQKSALIGLITSIGLNYRIPIFFTKNQKETAEFLYTIAKKEQLGNGSSVSKLRYSKTKMNFSDRQ